MKAANIISISVAMVLAVAGAARADFVLWGTEHLDVTSYHSTGALFDSSTGDVRTDGGISSAYVNNEALLTVSGGVVAYLYAYDSSSVDVSGGTVAYLSAYDSSGVDVSGGSVYGLMCAYETSSVDVSGGTVDYLSAYDSSGVDVSGGSVSELRAYGTSSVTFHGYDFRATSGLILDGDNVLGTGLLCGKWFDGTPWLITISDNDVGATVQVVPEPATLSLLAMGGLALIRRRP